MLFHISQYIILCFNLFLFNLKDTVFIKINNWINCLALLIHNKRILLKMFCCKGFYFLNFNIANMCNFPPSQKFLEHQNYLNLRKNISVLFVVKYYQECKLSKDTWKSILETGNVSDVICVIIFSLGKIVSNCT